jgi:hypothetical protein
LIALEHEGVRANQEVLGFKGLNGYKIFMEKAEKT